MKQPDIASLGLISDRHTCVILDKDGTISWYCPNAFDQPALFSSLIDVERGGYWDIQVKEKTFVKRSFDDRSSVLHTVFQTEGKKLELTDFMPLNAPFRGICRKTSAAPSTITGSVKLRGHYGLDEVDLQSLSLHKIQITGTDQWLHCSHALSIDDGIITYAIPKGEEGWVALVNSDEVDAAAIDQALANTLNRWKEIEKFISYQGPFETEVCNSLRALQQLVYEPTGGIVAAPTVGLPEVVGGKRNYDYRFVWMRDAALITSSLVGLETDGQLERNFLSFVGGAMKKNEQSHVSCFYGIDQSIKRHTEELALSGYRDSRPVMVGNTAVDQFQLDAESNILLACSLIYDKWGEKMEWETAGKIADYICKNWERKDNGIWEEEQVQHYTSSKALAARALELIAAYQPDDEIAERWNYNARLIRDFINANCITSHGAYAVYAGSEEVDISSALFAPFKFDTPESALMQTTIAQ